MSVIRDLIDRVNDPDLRARLNEVVTRMQKQKKFGLVFEEHLPEATPLYRDYLDNFSINYERYD